MRAYIIRRLLLMIPTVFLASLIIFFIIRLIPGDVIDDMAHDVAYGDPETYFTFRATVAHRLGLDVPLFTQ